MAEHSMEVAMTKESWQALRDIRERTGVQDDSAIVRSALRLQMGLLQAYGEKKNLFVREDDGRELPVELFLAA